MFSKESSTMTTTVTPEHSRDEYLARLSSLYRKVREWLKDSDPQARVDEEDTTISEEPGEPYRVKSLVIQRSGYKTVRLIPRGRWIIGAEGRVDVESDLGSETLLYEGGPIVDIREITESGLRLGRGNWNPLKDEEVAEGWVFLQNRDVGLRPTLSIDLFFRLLEVLGR